MSPHPEAFTACPAVTSGLDRSYEPCICYAMVTGREKKRMGAALARLMRTENLAFEAQVIALFGKVASS